MSVTTKTWPYGTKRLGTVHINITTREGWVQLVIDDTNEAHVLVGGAGDRQAGQGDTGTLTFTEGGPTGGYWKFEKQSG